MGIVFRLRHWKRRLGCAGWGAARALCIAEHRSQLCVSDVLLRGVGCGVCVIESLLIGGLFSGCEIGSEGCVALAGALQGHSALQSIDLSGAW